MYYYKNIDSPLGIITICINGKEIVGLWLIGQKYYGQPIKDQMIEKASDPLFDLAFNWLKRYFNKEKPDINELPLALIGSDFRKKVWQILCQIPYGTVITYKDIAKKLGNNNMSCQAVGGAVGHNPISLIIPCHRVVGTNSSLTGYAGGIANKIKLLELEGVALKENKVL